MRALRVFWLVAVASVSSCALASGAAFAVTVKVESTGATCPSVSISNHTPTGGCPWHATSNGPVEFGSFGAMITCDLEYSGRIDGSGVGYTNNITFSNCSGGSVVPCTEGTGGPVRAWSIAVVNGVQYRRTKCYIAFGITVNCTVENMVVAENSKGTHAATTISSPDGANHTDCDEFNGATYSGTDVMEADASNPELEIVD